MLVHTVNFGDLEVPDEKIINFREGLPGFPQIRHFTLLELDQIRPFRYLQSLDDPPIALLVINPFLVDHDYKFDISESDMDEICSRNTGDVSVYAVANVPEDPREATLNLMAPIVINDVNRCGKQVILHDSGYSVKFPLFGSPREADSAGT